MTQRDALPNSEPTFIEGGVALSFDDVPKTKFHIKAHPGATLRLKTKKDRPICPCCSEKMVRAQMQLGDSSWITVWICGCLNCCLSQEEEV